MSSPPALAVEPSSSRVPVDDVVDDRPFTAQPDDTAKEADLEKFRADWKQELSRKDEESHTHQTDKDTGGNLELLPTKDGSQAQQTVFLRYEFYLYGRPEPQIRRAVELDDVEQLRKVLDNVLAAQALPPSGHSENYDYKRLLRLSLLRSAELGKHRTAKLALELGANTDALPSRQSPLLRATLRGHIGVMQMLVKFGASANAEDRNGVTATMHAAINNNFDALLVLLRAGGNVNLKDAEGKTALHHLAAAKSSVVGSDLLDALLSRYEAIDEKDDNGRTAFQWACATGNVKLARRLLGGPCLGLVDINSRESLGRTPLHLAASHDQYDSVVLLLEHGADINARSSGGWTPLHIACQKAKFSGSDSGIASKLLENGALINVQTTTGETPLHLAAESGVQSIIESLLRYPDIKLNVRDEYGNTPFSKAVKAKSMPALLLLAPFHTARLSKEALNASKDYKATIVDFGDYPNGKRRIDTTIFNLLYASVPAELQSLFPTPGRRVSPSPDDATHFRWINLPSNNISWVEALLTKAFIEDGNYNVDKFMAVERTFEKLQRGQRFQSHYMRPFCEPTSEGVVGTVPPDSPPISPVVVPLLTVDEQKLQRKRRKKKTGKSLSSTGQGKGNLTLTSTEPKTDRKTSSLQYSAGKSSTAGEVRRFRNVPQWKIRAPSNRPSSSNTRNEGSPSFTNPSPVLHIDLHKEPKTSGSMFIVMPYIHFETDLAIPSMEQTIKKALTLDPEPTRMALNTAHVYQEASRKHPAPLSNHDFDIRTLSFYRKLNTRDVPSPQNKTGGGTVTASDDRQTLSLYMVGQLWMWIFSHNLIVTSLPQQWKLPEDDHLNVLEGIIKDIKNKSKETAPVNSVIELASIITARCIAMFDMRVLKDKDFPFLDMFESAVSSTDEQVDELFRGFNSDSQESSEWLKHRGGGNNKLRGDSRNKDDATGLDASAEPECVDRLLDINPETSLLDHIQSLRDEFLLLKTVLGNQETLLVDYMHKYRPREPENEEFNRFHRQQLRIVRTHQRDIQRMEQQISAVYASINSLLDLKHRYANVFEARFARYQATDTVHQGQTIMVFTIVTVIFLPLSFVGTLFTINISDFPQGDGGEPSMTLGYVSKWVFGIGFAISIPLVILALSYETMMRLIKGRQKALTERWRTRKRSRLQNEASMGNLDEKGWKDIDGTAHGSVGFDLLRARATKRKRIISSEEV